MFIDVYYGVPSIHFCVRLKDTETVGDLKDHIHPIVANYVSHAEKFVLRHEGRVANPDCALSEFTHESDGAVHFGVYRFRAHNYDPKLAEEIGRYVTDPETCKEYHVTVMDLCANLMCIRTEPSDTVLSLKERIHKVYGTPKDEQRLVFAGKQLDDDRDLSLYNIVSGSVIHLVLRLRGGGGGFEFASFDRMQGAMPTSNADADPWRLLHGSGIYLEGTCSNERCLVYGKNFIQEIGCDPCIDLHTMEERCACPMPACKEPADKMRAIIFYDCRATIRGVQKARDFEPARAPFRRDARTRPGQYVIERTYSTGAVYEELYANVRPLDAFTRDELCGVPLFDGTTDELCTKRMRDVLAEPSGNNSDELVPKRTADTKAKDE